MCIKSVKNLKFRLCLFWVKITSGNAFPYLRVFGCARKMHFSEMLFSWPVNGYKLISVFILPSNTHFPENTERVEWEGDAPTRRERERERKNQENPEVPDSDHRPWPRCTPKSIVIDPDRRPRPRCWIVLDPDRRPRSRRTLKPIVLKPDRCPRSRSRLSLNPIGFARSRLSSNPVATGLWIFFSGCYLCFWIEEWDYIFVW